MLEKRAKDVGDGGIDAGKELIDVGEVGNASHTTSEMRVTGETGWREKGEMNVVEKGGETRVKLIDGGQAGWWEGGGGLFGGRRALLDTNAHDPTFPPRNSGFYFIHPAISLRLQIIL